MVTYPSPRRLPSTAFTWTSDIPIDFASSTMLMLYDLAKPHVPMLRQEDVVRCADRLPSADGCHPEACPAASVGCILGDDGYYSPVCIAVKRQNQIIFPQVLYANELTFVHG